MTTATAIMILTALSLAALTLLVVSLTLGLYERVIPPKIVRIILTFLIISVLVVMFMMSPVANIAPLLQTIWYVGTHPG